MCEEKIKVYQVKTYEEYGLAKRNVEELTKKINSMELDDEISELETGIADLKQKLEEQKEYINNFINIQGNYDSKFLGSNLDYLLRRYGLRISDLEELLGVSAGYVSRTINPDSKKRLSVDIVWKISGIFQVNIDDLLNIDFQATPQSLNDVIAFFRRLKQETEETTIHWKNRSNKMEKHQGVFFEESDERKLDGSKSYYYAPHGYEETTKAIGLTDAIYSTDINIGTLYLLPLENLFGESGYEVYIYNGSYGIDDLELELICATFDDRSNTLKAICDELFKAVKLHEFDFVVSDSAKKLINKYLYQESNSSVYSDDSFMNIPDGIDDELPFT